MTFGKDTKDKGRLIITALDGVVHEELIPKWRRLNVFEGETVERGEILADGPMDPHDILRLLGVNALSNYIVNEVQDVYRLQGVKINDSILDAIDRLHALLGLRDAIHHKTILIQGRELDAAQRQSGDE